MIWMNTIPLSSMMPTCPERIMNWIMEIIIPSINQSIFDTVLAYYDGMNVSSIQLLRRLSKMLFT